MKVLVIPSNRADCLETFCQRWQSVKDWDELIVVWDGPASEAPSVPEAACVLSWDSIERDLGDDAWIVSRKNAGIRIAGYLEAARRGADVIATIDDDCYPAGDAFMRSHLDALFQTPRWVTSAMNMTARGVPYRNRGQLQSVHVNAGLWRTVGDYDAPHSLVLGADLQPFDPVAHPRIIARGQYVPVSTMNVAFRREALPLMYLPLMGQGQPYDRFDDIWGGVILKKVCDHLGWHVSVGRPVVDHHRASNPFRNLVKEAAGIERNETFWGDVDAVTLHASTPADCMNELAAVLVNYGDPHTQALGKAIPLWVKHAISI